MKRKHLLVTASIFLILTGILRGIGGIALLIKGSQLATNITIIANVLQIRLVAIGLISLCALLIYAGINLLRKNTYRSWYFCFILLCLFLLGGALNGYILFGHPVDQGQTTNFLAVIIIGLLLILGRPALKERS
ncbi:MAG: hypothetical protein IPN67_16885 [Bacteroidales bacterium]|nr:hypothetical protein [Bacteroidales bacterium]